MINRNKHIWEGWTVGDFIDDLNPMFRMIQNKHIPTHVEGFKSRQELKSWVKDNQPYYKKHIPEVYNYFLQKSGL